MANNERSARADQLNVAQRIAQRTEESLGIAVMLAQQQKGMEILTAYLKEQAAQFHKVSARLKMKEPAVKVVLNKR